VEQALTTFTAGVEREIRDLEQRNVELQDNVSEALAQAELARVDADHVRSEKDEALTKLGVVEDQLVAAEKRAAGRIAELEATNAMLARRDKDSRDEHTRLRAIITKRNTERAK
jgi:hypothetical protein